MGSGWPPGPRGSPVFGSLRELRRDRLGFLTGLAREYGDFVPFRLKRKTAVFINDPELIQIVVSHQAADFSKNFLSDFFHPAVRRHLLFSDADSWLEQRRLAAPIMRPDRMPAYCTLMVDQTRRAADAWRDGDCLDVAVEMRLLTLEVLARCLFEVELGDLAAEGAEIIDAVLADVGERAFDPWYTAIIPTPRNRQLWARLARGQRIIDQLIAERRLHLDGHEDLLSALIVNAGRDGRPLTDDQIKQAAVPLLFAGHETTASALSWTLHLLSRHPHVESLLVAEIDQVIGERPPSMQDVQQLKYAGRVLHESLRLYPPIWGFGREAVRDTALGGFDIAAGTIVFVSQWVLHRDPRYFENPSTFDPDRWSDGLASRLPRCAYMPFGAGPRRCLGSTFAILEAVLLLVTLYQRFTFSPNPYGEPAMEPLITLRPKGLRLVARRRKASQKLA